MKKPKFIRILFYNFINDLRRSVNVSAFKNKLFRNIIILSLLVLYFLTIYMITNFFGSPIEEFSKNQYDFLYKLNIANSLYYCSLISFIIFSISLFPTSCPKYLLYTSLSKRDIFNIYLSTLFLKYIFLFNILFSFNIFVLLKLFVPIDILYIYICGLFISTLLYLIFNLINSILVYVFSKFKNSFLLVIPYLLTLSIIAFVMYIVVMYTFDQSNYILVGYVLELLVIKPIYCSALIMMLLIIILSSALYFFQMKNLNLDSINLNYFTYSPKKKFTALIMKYIKFIIRYNGVGIALIWVFLGITFLNIFYDQSIGFSFLSLCIITPISNMYGEFLPEKKILNIYKIDEISNFLGMYLATIVFSSVFQFMSIILFIFKGGDVSAIIGEYLFVLLLLLMSLLVGITFPSTNSNNDLSAIKGFAVISIMVLLLSIAYNFDNIILINVVLLFECIVVSLFSFVFINSQSKNKKEDM